LGGIVAGLRSDLFLGDRALEAALSVDAAHIVRGAIGEHVKKIQTALALLLRDPPCGIADGEARAGRYGQTTAAAVLRYKSDHRIINIAYQRTPDDIVGKMTMRALDDAVAALEGDFGRAFLDILSRAAPTRTARPFRRSIEMVSS
jgi:peptidoglycan hydrolase-like protein with peptidoglycan-binding domain